MAPLQVPQHLSQLRDRVTSDNCTLPKLIAQPYHLPATWQAKLYHLSKPLPLSLWGEINLEQDNTRVSPHTHGIRFTGVFKKMPQLWTKVSFMNTAITLFACTSSAVRSYRESTNPWADLAQAPAILRCPQCIGIELITATLTHASFPTKVLTFQYSIHHDVLKTPEPRLGQGSEWLILTH